MSSSRLRRRRTAASCALAILASGVLAAPSFATTEYFFSPFVLLEANQSYVNGPNHSIGYIQGVSDHNNFCVAADANHGSSGPVFHTAPLTTSRAKGCSSTGGFAAISYSAFCCQIGEIENNNAFRIYVTNSSTAFVW